MICSSVRLDLSLGIPMGDAWLVQESDRSEYMHLQCAYRSDFSEQAILSGLFSFTFLSLPFQLVVLRRVAAVVGLEVGELAEMESAGGGQLSALCLHLWLPVHIVVAPILAQYGYADGEGHFLWVLVGDVAQAEGIHCLEPCVLGKEVL